jgi:phosphopantetheinyl transferase
MDDLWKVNDLSIRFRYIDAIPEIANDHAAWLSPKELERLDAITSANRKKTWLAGRYLIKTLARRLFPGTLQQDLELVSTDINGRGIPPCLICRGQVCPLQFSISHTDREVAVAMSRQPGHRLGIDLVELIRSNDRFERIRNHWLTENEQEQVAQADKREIARRWALKEAAYKSMRHTHAGFSPLHFEVLREETDHGWWQIRYNDQLLFRKKDITMLESHDSLFALVCRTET